MTQERGGEGRSSIVALLGVTVAVGVAYLAISGLRPSGPVSQTASPEVFSAQRAASHVETMAMAPHPVGSEEHARVREWLLEELRVLGLEPQVQSTLSARRGRTGRVVAAWVSNVLARVSGDDPTGAVLLVAHYDSVPGSPGAGDDASGVATILESARAILAGASLANDLILLFSDAEELGLLGARAFMEEHPWAQEVSLVINLEARGAGGRSMMFETGPGNGRLIRALKRAAPYPFATSLSYEIYRRMPNDTDFSVFKEAGLPGFNFAFIEDHAAYHTRLDAPGRLDLGSVQHHGANMLALARHFGDANLENLTTTDSVYFNPTPWSWSLVVYSRAWVLPLSVVLLMGWMALLIWAQRRQMATVAGSLQGFGLFLSALVLGSLAVSGIWILVERAAPSMLQAPHGLPYDSGWLMVALVLVAVAVVAAVYRWVPTVSVVDLTLGHLLGWALLNAAVSALAPGGSFVFCWPLAVSLAALAVILARGRGRSFSPPDLLIHSLAGLVGVVLLAPLAFFVLAGLSLNMAGWVTPWALLPATLLAPQLAILARDRVPWLPVLALVLALGLGGWRMAATEPDADRPRTDSLFYLLDADSGKASWVSFDTAADAWTTQFLGQEPRREAFTEVLPTYKQEVLQGSAPVATLAAPQGRLVSDDWEEDTRVLEVEIVSGRKASVMRLSAAAMAEVLAVRINGKRVELEAEDRVSAEPLQILCFGVPGEGFLLAFEMADRQPVELNVLDLSFGLPDLRDFEWQPRPAWLIPGGSWLNDTTGVRATLWF